MLKQFHTEGILEAGCDEAGRGCLAGPVFAAAVILPPGFSDEKLNDSKKITARERERLRLLIESKALAWAVASIDNDLIDQVNILKASILAMHAALAKLSVRPGLILADGNRFLPYPGIPHLCIVKGDAIYQSIAAASILAKTYRDEYMRKIDSQHPQYGWTRNKGYPTQAHRKAIELHGITPYHRKSFRLGEQMKLFQSG